MTHPTEYYAGYKQEGHLYVLIQKGVYDIYQGAKQVAEKDTDPICMSKNTYIYVHRKFQKLLILVTVNSKEKIPSDMKRNFYFAFYILLYSFSCFNMRNMQIYIVHYKMVIFKYT